MTAECANPKCKGRAANSFLCPQCVAQLRHQLLGLPTLIEHLADAANGNTRLSADFSRLFGFESRQPVVDHRALRLINDIGDTIGGWARGTARIHRLMISPPINWHRPISEYRHTTKDFAMFLAAHVDLLGKDPDVGELCTSLTSHIRRGLGIVNRRIPPQFCGPCPATISDHRKCVSVDAGGFCAGREHECTTRLMAPRGAAEVSCPFCGTTHRVEKLVTQLLARADHFRCTIPDMYRVMLMLGEPVKLRTLYVWAANGKLRPSGYIRADKKIIGITKRNDDDKPIYRVSDARKQRLNKAKPSKSEGSQGK